MRAIGRSVFLVAALATVAAVMPGRALGLDAQEVIEQKEQNAEWERDARGRETDLVNAANQFYSQKKFEKASELYRKALSIRYEQWTFETKSVGGERTQVPTYKKGRYKLDTSNSRMARDRLDTMDEAVKAEEERAAAAKVSKQMQEAEAAARKKDTLKACELMSEVLEAGETFTGSRQIQVQADKARRRMKEMLAPAYKALDAVDKALKEEKGEEAFAAFGEFRKTYDGYLKFSAELSARVEAIGQRPEIAAQVRAQEATTQLALVDVAVARGDYQRAIQALRAVMVRYTGTEAARVAGDRLKQLESDPAVQAALEKKQMDEKCRALLNEVDSLRRRGETETARALCVRIIADYPDSEWAKKAGEIEAGLPK